MMPGETQSKVAEIASDATSGTCQNCTVLNQRNIMPVKIQKATSLDEYVAALITLKQKIIDTDRLLSEYKEKCDELQKSQRESSKLHRQLDEVLMKLEPLEKQTAEYEHTKTELEKTKADLRCYQQKCEDVEKLRADNAQTLSLKEKAEESLRKAEDTVQRQNLENETLRAQQKKLEEDLQKTQDSLDEYLQIAEEVENLKLENAKTLILKGNIENELLVLKETRAQQSNEILDLKSEKTRLEEILHTTQQRLNTLEKEFNKEKRSTSSQTDAELHIDKGKVRKLLEELWRCVEPSSQTNELLLLNGEPTLLKTQPNRTPPQQMLTSPLREPSPQTNKQLLLNEVPSPLKIQLNRTPPQQVLTSPLREPSLQTNEQLLLNEEPALLKTQLKRTPPQQMLTSPSRTQDPCSSPWKPSPETHSLSSNLGASPEIISPKSSPQKNLIKPNKKQHSSTRSRKRKIRSDALEHVDHQTNEVDESSQKEINNKDLLCEDYDTDFEEITELFRPLPDVLSPLQSPLTELVCSNDDQPVLDILEEDQLETLSNLNILNNTTCTDTEHQKSKEVETASICESSLNHLNTESVDNLDLENASFDSQCMEVEDMSEVKQSLVGDTQNPAAQPSVENVDTVESSLEEDPKQAVEEDLLVNQNLDATQSEATKVPNIAVNSLETLNSQPCVDPDPISTNCVESADYNHSQMQSLKSNENSVTTLDVNCSRLDGPENKELKPPVHLELRMVTDISTHDIQTNTLTSALIEHQKSSHDNDVSSLKSSKDVESSSEDEGHFGLKRKVRRVRSRSEVRISLEELDNVSETLHCSSANHLSKDELSENTAKSYSGLSIEDMEPDDEREAKPSDIESETATEDTQDVDDSKNLRKTSPQMNDRSPQQNEMLIDDLSSGIESLDGNVYNNSIASGDSAVDCPEGTGTSSHLSLDAGNSENEEKVSDPNTKAHVTPTPCLSRVRTEMGPPLPPVVMPLTATPPRFVKHHTPTKPTPSRLATDGPKSPKKPTSVPVIDSALPDASKMSPCLATPSPSRGVPSSPLQFGSATPKHAVPVPGRLPSSAISSSPPAASPQENSMQMLDSMYPELSARARTLNILRGNVNLNRAGNENGASPTSISQISGNKSISSSSTAFTKTEQKPKRTGVNMLLPKSAKRLRLDNCSPAPAMVSPAEQVMDHQPLGVIKTDSSKSPQDIQSNRTNLKVEEKPDTKKDGKQIQISEALAKIAATCFEVLPVVKSHVFLGRISQQPILIDEEKAVIADFCVCQSSAEDLMSAILTKLKTERSILNCANMQALCRVYTGLCRQIGDYQKAHALAYSILKEDFPDACKLILFMVTTWPSVLFHDTSLCRAIQTVAKLKAEGEILEYLTKYLHWDKSPPHDISKMVTSTLKALREDKELTFQKHQRHGHDLCPAAWEYIYTLDLLCTHMKWKWTHDVVIGKELWPIMNAWVTQQRPLQTPIRDVSVAAVLRIIGRLGQLGIKQRLFKSVQNVAKAINLFGKHGITEGVPDEVQLSAVYAIYDLAPCNPKEALEALASWRSETSQQVPSAVTSCITQIGSLCRQIKS
ncbi:little elongation complex subunit 1 isoform X1 [Misgurnus anguillicaudatus]|uniref:little elongation complex subunit 1 isoform X1 n=1 Tax=Misgurnus anguillicaudatus TaxID=75329 RepID=UPI003CCF5EA9